MSIPKIAEQLNPTQGAYFGDSDRRIRLYRMPADQMAVLCHPIRPVDVALEPSGHRIVFPPCRLTCLPKIQPTTRLKCWDE